MPDCGVSGSRTAQAAMTKGCNDCKQHAHGRTPDVEEDVGHRESAKAELNLEDVARLELGETPQTKAEALVRLRQLLEGEQALKVPPGDDFLVMFLRARKYRVEDAFKVIKNYFRARRDTPEFFDGLVPDKVPFRTVCHDHKLLLISPEPGEHGRSMGVFNVGAWNPDVCSLMDFVRAVLLLTGSWLLEDQPTICGVEFVMDMKGLNIDHLKHMTPPFLMKVAHITQDCWPVRIKAVYIINHPKIFEVIFAAIKPFLRSKLLSRMPRPRFEPATRGPAAEYNSHYTTVAGRVVCMNKVHFIGQTSAKMWDPFPRDLVPSEHGGRRDHFDYDRQEQFVRSRSAFFESLCGYGYTK